MIWTQPSQLFAAVDDLRESRAEEGRRARIQAIRSTPVQSPILTLVREPKGFGRPSVQDDRDIRTELLERIAKGEARYQAARAVGWSGSTLDRKLRADEYLREQVHEARAEALADRAGHVLKVSPIIRRGAYRFVGECSCGWKTRALFAKLSVRPVHRRHVEQLTAVVGER
jgi:hypothetical protein